MVQTATWTTTYRVPNTLLSDTAESVVGTQWHQDARDQLTDMLRIAANRQKLHSPLGLSCTDGGPGAH
jgi:hypothetical protein